MLYHLHCHLCGAAAAVGAAAVAALLLLAVEAPGMHPATAVNTGKPSLHTASIIFVMSVVDS